jgi:hypothetical protein
MQLQSIPRDWSSGFARFKNGFASSLELWYPLIDGRELELLVNVCLCALGNALGRVSFAAGLVGGVTGFLYF